MKELPVEKFYKHPTGKDKLQPQCKTCQAERAKILGQFPSLKNPTPKIYGNYKNRKGNHKPRSIYNFRTTYR